MREKKLIQRNLKFEYTVMMISVSSNDDDKFNRVSYLGVCSASLNFATGLVIAPLFCI